jgi:thiol-disulfide isomerase/thioredoxin
LTLFIYAVVGLAVTWLLYVGYLHIATRVSEGRSTQPLHGLIPELERHDGRALVYCYTPQCRPCRPMSREVDRLAEQGAPVFKLDIHAHPELAREFGIRATPTLIVIDNGVVSRMSLGVKTADGMLRLLDASST